MAKLLLVVRKTMNAIELENVGSEPGKPGWWLTWVRRQVGSLDFGGVQIIVHAAEVVQIERTEKTRLETPLLGQSQGPSFARQSSGG